MSKTMILVIFSYLIASCCIWSVSSQVFTFGQTAPFSGGIISELGVEANRGIVTAFMEYNETVSNYTNLFFRLISYDDVNLPAAAANNTRRLVQEDNVFGMVGIGGQFLALAAISELKNISRNDMYVSFASTSLLFWDHFWATNPGHSDTCPFQMGRFEPLTTLPESDGVLRSPVVGTITGASSLRIPFQENVINVRPANLDETYQMVGFLASKRGFSRISVVYQNDSLGINAVAVLRRAMRAKGLQLESEAFVDTVNPNVDAALNTIYAEPLQPEAVIILTIHPIAINIISFSRANYTKASNIVFMSGSILSPLGFVQGLQAQNQSLSNIYMTQPIPPPTDNSSAVVRNFQRALARYYPGATPTSYSLEGYLVGSFVTEVVTRIRGPKTPRSFIDAVYSSRLFVIADRQLGPYQGPNSTEPCNQGMREVFLWKPQNDGNYLLDSEFPRLTYDGCLSSTSTGLNSTYLTWGLSTALSNSPNAVLGQRIRDGIKAAFAESNRLDALDGVFLELLTLDDRGSGPRAYENALSLISNNTFGFVGTYGSPTTNSTIKALQNVGLNLPVVAPFTGTQLVREPFQRNIINLRASFRDECYAIVNWLTSQLLTRISLLRENDTYGEEVRDALVAALDVVSLNITSEGVYDPTTNNVDSALSIILGSTGRQPQAIIIAGTFGAAVRSVIYGRSLNALGAQAYYIPLSLVGITSFRDGLIAANQSTSRIIVTQSIKQDAESILLARATAALREIGTSVTGFSVEGYLAGRFIIDVLSKTLRPYTPQNFLESIYTNQVFLIDQQRLGLFADATTGATRVCNQGSKEVYLMTLDPVTGNFSYLSGSEFSWGDTCQSSTADLIRPIVFGQAAPLTGPNSNLGINMRDGITIAFEHVNRLGGIEGRPLKLITHDDGYVESLTRSITEDLITDGAIGLIGFVGTQNTLAAVNISRPARIPIIGPYTGAQSLRIPCSKMLLHTRASYNDEAGAIVSFLVDSKFSSNRNGRQFSRIAIFYQDDLFGQTVRDAVVRELGYRNRSLVSEASYSRNTLDIEIGLVQLARVSPAPDAIISICTYGPCAEFVRRFKRTSPVDVVYISVSSVSADDFSAALSATSTPLFDSVGNPTVYATQVMPSPFDTSDALVAEYIDEIRMHGPDLKPNYVSLEGYVAGRLAIRALQVSAVPLGTPALLSVFDFPLFNIRGLLLGPYAAESVEGDQCTCNQGLHRVWLTYMETNASIVQMNNFDFSFDTCNYQFLSPVPPNAASPDLDVIGAARGVIAGAVVGAVALICIAFAIVIIVLKKKGYLTKKRPAPMARMMTRDQIKGLIPAKPSNSSGTKLPNSSGATIPTPQPELVDGWQENWMIPESELQLKKKIGSGAYGAVYKASWKGVTVAVKQALAISLDDQAISAFKREAKIMLSIRPHPNVLTVYGVMISDKVYIVLDYCDLGALSNLFGSGKLSSKRKARIVHDVAAGLSHLHDCNIVHRDVAARNVLLQSGYRCKLSDFGMARAVDKLTKEHTTASTIGPIKWMAPESLRKRKFSFASDVYSFGVTCCEIYAEMPPFMGMELMDAAIAIRDNGLTPDIPQEMPKYLRRLVKRCFDPDPALRPSMRDILLVIQASNDYLSDSDGSQR